MFELDIRYAKDDKPFLELVCSARECTVGKARDCIARLRGWKVANYHARFEHTVAGVFVEDVSRGFGMIVNGAPSERHGPLTEQDAIVIGGYKILVKAEKKQELPEEESIAESLAHPAVRPVEAEQKLYMHWSKYVHGELFRLMDLRRTDLDSMGQDKLREYLSELVDEVLAEVGGRIPAEISLDRLKKVVLDEAVGLGPLEEFLADTSITEIMVNRHDDIYIEREGKLEKTAINFSSDAAVLSTIERIISPIGRRIDESSPMVDARLQDGSRVNAIIPPLALKGPCLTIRKFSEGKLGAEDLLKYGSINEPMISFMKTAVEQRRNVVVSGGTGSGKTTLLNILSNFIPVSERVITVEDAAELKLVQPHVVSLEARPANMEGKGHISIRDLVKNCLRMRPDRIVVGECRGGEALDMLQAMNTGHDGSLTTAHANTPRDLLSRLEVMVLMAGMDLPVTAIREQVSSAVDVIVQQTRFADGSRRITSITEVTGIESGTIQLNEIFRFRQQGFDENGRVVGRFEATGRVPEFYEELRERGVGVDMDIFAEAV